MKTALIPQQPTLDEVALPAEVQPESVSLFERLARDPNVDVDKLERLMQMHERVLARNAEAAFNAAMAAAQMQMRPVVADAANPQTRSRYVSYEALDRALRPIYTLHGIGLSFDTGESPHPEYVRVLCYAAHREGHSRTYHVDMPADGKGAKGGDVMTKTHATGSALSYGQRYLLKLIFNVAVSEDDDGNLAAGVKVPDAPHGYDDWLTDLSACADEGLPKLTDTWNRSKKDYRDHLIKTNRNGWEGLKKKAALAGKGTR